MYSRQEFPLYREPQGELLSSAEMQQARKEFTIRADETQRYLARYRRHSNVVQVRAMITSLQRLEIERQKFFESQEHLRLQQMQSTLAA